VVIIKLNKIILRDADSTSPTVDDPIWNVYAQAATAWDEKMIQGWTQSMDVLLIFVR
jgi:hypothetical protein